MVAQDLQHIKQRFGIIGQSPALLRALEVAMQVAPTQMSILITGESGSGKEALAKLIHHLSDRKHSPIVTINCGAIPEGTMDSELFGHEKGAFTDAFIARKGYIEEADKGTLFLDEIGEMPPGTQARLLRVLEQGEYMRVGSSKISKVDIRIIAATNIDILQAINKHTFRHDLYHRLTLPLRLPPLRERKEDIHLLFKKFALDFADQYHTSPIKLTPKATQNILTYHFPGNIRQLKNLVSHISILEKDNRTIDEHTLANYLPKDQGTLLISVPQPQNIIEEERKILYKLLLDLQQEIQQIKNILFNQLHHHNDGQQILKTHSHLFHNLIPSHSDTPQLISEPSSETTKEESQPIQLQETSPSIQDLNLAKKEKEWIKQALKLCQNNRKKAANVLGMTERTLYRRIRDYELKKNTST